LVKPKRITNYVETYQGVLNELGKKAPDEIRSLLPDHVLAKQEIRVYLTFRTGVAIEYLGIASKATIHFQVSALSFDDLIFPPTNPTVPPEVGAINLKPLKAGLPEEPIPTLTIMGSMAGLVLFRTDNSHVFTCSKKIMNENRGRYTFFNIYVQRQYQNGKIMSKLTKYAELYSDKDEFFTTANAEKNAAKDFEDYIQFLKTPEMAPSAQKYVRIGEAVKQLKKDSVAVLGKDSPPEVDMLRRIRDELATLGYSSFLVREETSLSGQTPEEKARLLTLMSKFCVMEDSAASGHIAEFEYCKANRIVLILLRKPGHGSTWMIGDAGLVDVNYIRTFEYSNDSLHEVLVAAVKWAEDFLKRRVEVYGAYLP
jgi:hypothetical protein